MKRIGLVLLLSLLLLLSGCDWISRLSSDRNEPTSKTPFGTGENSTSTSTVPRLPTEPPTTEAGEFPNEPEDDHSKRY